MGATKVLDHALFRLTPTRTRCDLLAVGEGGDDSDSPETIASGLVQPFLSHLRAARDLIPKGGYSFTLRPPASPYPAFWFTRPTLRRFVRFVATPEILERVVTIEKEILQIDESIQREDLSSPATGNGIAKKTPVNPSKGNEGGGKDDETEGESSKICLVRVLENRKMMLEKEQGMAYARASVAGFDKANIDDLISFADAFGADRLREACVNFKEVCEEKEQDKLWMDELAALEASRAAQVSYNTGASGITLSSEVNADGQSEQNGADDSTRASMANGSGSVPWNSGPYMYNFQNSGIPGSAPFPGYAFPFPGMQMIPPYSGYPENFPWSHRGEEKDTDGGRSRGMHEKLHRNAETARSTRDEYSNNESSNSGSEADEYNVSTDVDSYKRNRHKKSKKKSSRTVVIRNINYISSKGRHGEDGSSGNSSAEDDLIDGDSLRRQVEGIVGSFGKHQSSSRHQNKNKSEKRNSGGSNVLADSDENKVEDDDDASTKVAKEKTGGGWGAFQDILMREDLHSDETVQRKADVLTSTSLQPGDVAGDYCLPKNGETAPSSTDRYQPQDEFVRGIKPKLRAADPLIDGMIEGDYAGNDRLENFEYTESKGRVVKRTQNAGEDLLFSDRANPEMVSNEVLSNVAEESSRFRAQRDGDWFLTSGSGDKFGKKEISDQMIFEGEQIMRAEHKNVQREKILDVAVDDSFIAPSRVAEVEREPFSLFETDLNIISGGAATGSDGSAANQSKETRKPEFHEPEELQLMLERHDADDARSSWTPEIEYAIDTTKGTIEERKVVPEAVPEASNPVNDKKTSGTKATKTKTQPPPKSSPLNRSVTKNKLDALSRPKTISTFGRKGSTASKTAKEEVERRRLEELRIEREKRIAQRSASMGRVASSKLNGTERKTSMGKPPASQTSKQHGFGYGPKFSQPKGVASKS